MKIDIERHVELSSSMRARQLSAIFDVPMSEAVTQHWRGELPIEDEAWNVGLIVGPSGAGKSTVLRDVFGAPVTQKWSKSSVLDDFDSKLTVQEISDACSAVGFNTIPAWLRPYKVLSNGEQFRVQLARALLESRQRIVIDEFTSVVDRQVAKIAAHATQKWVRAHERQFVAASCHYDIVDWLQPDWIFEPHTMLFRRRHLQRRPSVEISVGRVPIAAWALFSPFHYLTAKLNRSAKCWGLWADGVLAAFVGVLPRGGSRTQDIERTPTPYGISRAVTLPDWQGLGLIMILMERVAAAFKTYERPMRIYPAHPPFVRSADRSPNWQLEKKPGTFRTVSSTSDYYGGDSWRPGERMSATFRYVGDALPERDAAAILGGVYSWST